MILIMSSFCCIFSTRKELTQPIFFFNSLKSVFPNSLPKTFTFPELGHILPEIIFNKEVFPAPLGPIKAQCSPLFIFHEMPFSICVFPLYKDISHSSIMEFILINYFLIGIGILYYLTGFLLLYIILSLQ